jgi:DNA-binding winged helix-turn-helix (wHTH) protein/tetratricopeptide (TPR) repeat protein
MVASIFRFRNFRLDPQARELYQDDTLIALPVSTLDCLIYLIRHRERSVGRDELTAAVWGRVDVSDVSLSHAIMRLRRLLGDTGNEQNSIRTLPRLGYRWIVEPTFEELSARSAAIGADAAIASPESDADTTSGRAPAATAPARRPRVAVLGRWGAVVLLGLFVAGMLALLPTWRGEHRNEEAAEHSNRVPAMVLPAEVDAPGDWAWLRLGLMDLIANHLRRGNLATTPSETVVGLVNAHHFDAANRSDDPAFAGAATLLIRPHVALTSGTWSVRLEARSNGNTLLAEAQAGDALSAGRAAADDLLIKLGRTPPPSEGDPSRALEELAQRINAAVLAGQLQVARDLIKSAPAAAQASPEIALSTAAIEFFSGEYEASRKHAESLLDQLAADKNPRLRARVLNRLGATYFRQDRFDDADRVFIEAIQLLELRDDPDTLATAYTGRGAVAGHAQRLDAAAAFFGRARTLHEMSNDAFGVARVDLNLGAIAMDRGQPAAAVPIFENAAARFESLSTPEALNSALRTLADAHSMLLEHEQALATTDRFWPVETHSRNPRESWWLTLSRAVALAGMGRLHDAEDLIKRVRESSDPAEDAMARLEADVVAADIALSRGQNAQAATLAAGASTPELEASNPQDYLSAWFTRIRGLQRSGQSTQAAESVRRLRAWVDAAPSDSRLLYAGLAEADLMRAQGKHEAALQLYADVMARAERMAIPENLLIVGEPYVGALIEAGQIDQASAIAGRLARWAEQDMRAAWVQAQVYQALHKGDAARTALQRARQLAGERVLIGDTPASGR